MAMIVLHCNGDSVNRGMAYCALFPLLVTGRLYATAATTRTLLDHSVISWKGGEQELA